MYYEYFDDEYSYSRWGVHDNLVGASDEQYLGDFQGNKLRARDTEERKKETPRLAA